MPAKLVYLSSGDTDAVVKLIEYEISMITHDTHGDDRPEFASDKAIQEYKATLLRVITQLLAAHPTLETSLKVGEEGVEQVRRLLKAFPLSTRRAHTRPIFLLRRESEDISRMAQDAIEQNKHDLSKFSDLALNAEGRKVLKKDSAQKRTLIREIDKIWGGPRL